MYKLKTLINFGRKTVIFKKKDEREYNVRSSQAGHYVINFEKEKNKPVMTHLAEHGKGMICIRKSENFIE